jgi:hypothetical protein
MLRALALGLRVIALAGLGVRHLVPRCVWVISAGTFSIPLLACENEHFEGAAMMSPKPDDAECAGAVPTIFGVTAEASTTNLLAYSIEWDTNERVPSQLAAACNGEVVAELARNSKAEHHEAFVVGWLPSGDCELVITAQNACGKSTHTSNLRVDGVPDFLPEVTVDVLEADRVGRGWTLINLSNARDAIPYIVAAIDAQGRYRWYHQRQDQPAGSDAPVVRFEDGVLCGGRDVSLAYLDWRGRIVWEARDDLVEYHHDVGPAREPGEILFLQHSTGGSSDIVRWDLTTDRETWRWVLLEHYAPPEAFTDWSHVNGVSYVPNEQAMLLSSRSLNAVYKIDLTTERIVWKLGFDGRPGEDGFRGDFEMAERDRFYNQHAPEAQADGNIVLFDNGAYGIRESSRAVEYELDTSVEPPRARVVWEFSPTPPIFAPIWGDADRLSNGNTLITFGRLGNADHERTTFVEVDAEGEVVWQATLSAGWGSYRAERMADVPQGFVGQE